jgi:hypothetical protein
MDIPSSGAFAAVERSAALTRKSVAYLQKNLRYLQADPSFFLMKTAARFELTRKRAGLETRSPLTMETAALQTRASIDEALDDLDRDGYYVGLQLQPELLQALRAHAMASPCYADRRADLPFYVDERAQLEERLQRPLRVASYFESQNDWPAFRALRDDPLLAILARGYLGSEPQYIRSELAWTFPGARTRDEEVAEAHVFHCDINDYRTLKFFFYLNDVGEEDGPHEYIRRHPRGRKWIHQLMGQRVAALPEGELQRIYGPDRVVRVCGPAGLGFAGDPYTFHRGRSPAHAPRLLLQIELGQRRYKTWYFDV